MVKAEESLKAFASSAAEHFCENGLVNRYTCIISERLAAALAAPKR